MMMLAIFAFTLSTHAAPLEEALLKRLNHARDARTVHAINQEYERIRITRGACRLQLRAQSVPYACYEAMSAESKWRVGPATSRLRSRLDAVCARAARDLKLPTGGDDRVLSPACRRDVARARQVRDYREPASVWSGN